MKNATKKALKVLVQDYDRTIGIMESDANDNTDRAYGGFVRQAKGKLQEYITKRLIEIAWIDELGQDKSRLDINSSKIPIPIKLEYLTRIPDYVKKDIESHIEDFVYKLSVDRHVFIDGKFILGIECKAYTENAMIKRIMVDFMFLKTLYPDLKCFLFQLESMLGGDYDQVTDKPLGGTATHSIMSYFDTVDLNILTMIKGVRKVDEPINKPEFYKPLEMSALVRGVKMLVEELKIYAK